MKTFLKNTVFIEAINDLYKIYNFSDTEAKNHLEAIWDKLTPTEIAYLNFVVENSKETQWTGADELKPDFE